MIASFMERLRRLSPAYAAEQNDLLERPQTSKEKHAPAVDQLAQSLGHKTWGDLMEHEWREYYRTPALFKPRARRGVIDGQPCWRLHSVRRPDGKKTVAYGRSLAEAYVIFKNQESAPAGCR